MNYEIEADESVSRAVIRAVSAVAGRESERMPPLTRVLDPAALDELFGPQSDGTSRTGGRLSLVYGGCHVTVDNGEYLTVELLDNCPPTVIDREARVTADE